MEKTILVASVVVAPVRDTAMALLLLLLSLLFEIIFVWKDG
jgi:hypothetical protein